MPPQKYLCTWNTERANPVLSKMSNHQNVGYFRPDCSYGLELLIELKVWKTELFWSYASVVRIQVFWQTSETEHSSNKAAFHCISETLLSLPSPFSWHSLLPQWPQCGSFPLDVLLFSSTQTFKFTFRREHQSLILLGPSRALSALWSKWVRSLMTTSLYKA